MWCPCLDKSMHFAYWKEGGLESPIPPVLSAGGGGKGGGGGEGWVVVSTGGTTATGGSATAVSEETNWEEGEAKQFRAIKRTIIQNAKQEIKP